jgi:hypothetical protein
MYIVDGIAYAGEATPAVKISGVRPMSEHRLWLRFSNGEARIFDFTPLLKSPAFAKLTDPDVFSGVYIDYGVTVWNNGEIDIAPEYLYSNSVPAEENIA